MIGADKVHSLGFMGTGQAVAVLDTGIQLDHPAFSGTKIAVACFSTAKSAVYNVKSLCPNEFDMSTMADAASHCPTEIDACEHGTHVAGIISGHTMAFSPGKSADGVAPAADIVAIQVFTLFQGEACGGGPDSKCILSFTSDQLRALEWVYKHRKDLKVASINMSLGSGYHDTNCDSTSALTEIIERLRSKGIATIVAAGNDGFNDGLAEPACISAAVSVAALNKSGQLDIDYTDVSTLISIAAPGTNIISAIPGSKFLALSGTSMAAPHVSAAFALLRQKYPSATVSELEARLVDSGHVVTDPRTGTKLVSLDVVAAISGPAVAAVASGAGSSRALSGLAAAAAAAPVAAAAAAAPVPAAGETAGPAGAGSFILKTEESAADSQSDIQSVLENGCPQLSCTLKQIGQDTFKLDIVPKGDMAPTDRKAFTISPGDVKALLKALPYDVKVFDNRLSNPM